MPQVFFDREQEKPPLDRKKDKEGRWGINQSQGDYKKQIQLALIKKKNHSYKKKIYQEAPKGDVKKLSYPKSPPHF